MVYWLKGHTRHAVLPLWPCRDFQNSSAHLPSGSWESDGIPVKKAGRLKLFSEGLSAACDYLEKWPDRTTADLFISLPFLAVLLRFPGCDSSPCPHQLCRPQRCPQQPQLLYEPPTDPNSQQPHSLPLPLAQFSDQHPRYFDLSLLMCVFLKRKWNSFYM